MICLVKAHREDLAGIGAIRGTIDFLSRENSLQRGIIETKDAQLAIQRDEIEYLRELIEKVRLDSRDDLDRERSDRKTVTDKMLSVAGFGKVYDETPQIPLAEPAVNHGDVLQEASAPSPQNSTPIQFGDITQYIQAAELAEAKIAAEDRRRLLEEEKNVSK